MPRAKGSLHFRCTYLDCGQVFDNHDDLTTHNMHTHENNIKLAIHAPVRQDSGVGLTADVGYGVAKVEADVKPSLIKEDTEVKKDGKLPVMHNWPVKKDAEVAVGRATMARPGLKRRGTSKMDRNALANPGASMWPSKGV